MAVAVPGTAKAPAVDEHAQLTRMVRVMFPHAKFPDGPYERCAKAILDGAGDDLRLRTQLTQGLRDLDATGAKPFRDLDDAAALALLEGIQQSEFFQSVRGAVITSLYDDPEVWAQLGYEGDATQNGGYAGNYGALDWLPEPRIEEAS
jgi:hypothetical protein